MERSRNTVRRGEIYEADLSPVVGSEQGVMRPVLIVQNDVGNRYSPTVIAAAITSQQNKAKLPTHIEISAKSVGLSKNSVVLLEQIRTLDKRRLKERMGSLDTEMMHRVDDAIAAAGPAAFFIFIEERLVRDPLRICCRPLPSGRCI